MLNIYLWNTLFSVSSLFSGVGRYHVVCLCLTDVFEVIAQDQHIKNIAK